MGADQRSHIDGDDICILVQCRAPAVFLRGVVARAPVFTNQPFSFTSWAILSGESARNYKMREGGSERMPRCEKKQRGGEIIAAVVFSFTSWANLSGESARTIG